MQMPGSWKDKATAAIMLILMLIVDYQLGGTYWQYYNTITDEVLKWVLIIAMIITMTVGTFMLPILITTGKKIKATNGVIGILALMITAPISMAIIQMSTILLPLIPTNIRYIPEIIVILIVTIIVYVFPISIMLKSDAMTSL